MIYVGVLDLIVFGVGMALLGAMLGAMVGFSLALRYMNDEGRGIRSGGSQG